jgi:hypothetical protein
MAAQRHRGPVRPAGLATYLDVAADAQYHQAAINDHQASAVRYQETVAVCANSAFRAS